MSVTVKYMKKRYQYVCSVTVCMIEQCSIVIIYARCAITRFYDLLVSQRSR